jgi:hypothetical protein
MQAICNLFVPKWEGESINLSVKIEGFCIPTSDALIKTTTK